MSVHDKLAASGVSRRDMLRIGAGGVGFSLFGGIGPVPAVFGKAIEATAASASGKILVVFEWFGGNDGLNTIVPYGDAAYYKHRPTIGIKEKDVLKIDAHFGWQKSMGGLKRLYDEDKVAIVQGVGYAQPSFSHFTSMSFWHTAAPNGGNEYGWVGRTAAALDSSGARPNMIVSVRRSRRSTRRSICWACSILRSAPHTATPRRSPGALRKPPRSYAPRGATTKARTTPISGCSISTRSRR